MNTHHPVVTPMWIPAPRFLSLVKSHFLCFRTPPTPRSPFTLVRPPPPCPPPPHTPPAPPPHPPSPLHGACVCGVWCGADVCVPLCVSCEQGGVTPLLRACLYGRRDMALRLLHHGADPTNTDTYVSPPLLPCVTRVCVGCGGCTGMCAGGRVTGRVLRGIRPQILGVAFFLQFLPSFEI